MKSLAWSVLAAIVLLPVGARGEEIKTTELAVGTAQRLLFEHPASWKAEVSGPSVNPTLHFGPAGKGDFSILLTAFPPMHGVPASEKELTAMVRGEGDGLLPTAVQKQLELQPVKGPQVVGSLFHLTDRKPEAGPGDYREMYQGAVLVGQIYLTFRIVTHSEDTPTVDAALKTLAAVRVESTQQKP